MKSNKNIIAIAGATSPKGKALKEALPTSLFSRSTVRLLDEEDLEGTLTEYDGGVELIKKMTLEALEKVDFVFLCHSDEKSIAISKMIRDNLQEHPPVIINLSGFFPDDDPAVLMTSTLPKASKPANTVYIPDALATGLATILDVCRAFESIEFASASAMLPVSEIGAEGITALQDQVVELMNFGEVPKDIFGGQLIFNIQTGYDSAKSHGMTEYEERVIGQTRQLLDDPDLALAVVTARVPIFYSILVVMTIKFKAEIELSRLLSAFEQSDLTKLSIISGGKRAITGPLESTGSDSIHIHKVMKIPGSPDGLQVWFSYDNITTGSVNHAVKIAEHLFRDRKSGGNN